MIFCFFDLCFCSCVVFMFDWLFSYMHCSTDMHGLHMYIYTYTCIICKCNAMFACIACITTCMASIHTVSPAGTTTATASWWLQGRQDVGVVILVIVVVAALACCLLLAVELQLDLNMLLLFLFQMEIQLLPRGGGRKGLSLLS